MGNILQALQDSRKALELGCNCPRAHKTMGILLSRLGAISHAREHSGMPGVNVTEEEMEALLLIENNVKSGDQERARLENRNEKSIWE